MKILVTGANGFIGRNLITRISELNGFEALPFIRTDSIDRLVELVEIADAIVHLAGENRPADDIAYEKGNAEFTRLLCEIVLRSSREIPFIFTSSTQTLKDNPYGRSKLAAEDAVKKLASSSKNTIIIYRLPGVFGKWCKPNYNSVVATFCHNIALDLPLKISDPMHLITLVYIDDVIEDFLKIITQDSDPCIEYKAVEPFYSISLKELEIQIRAFSKCRTSLVSERVGTGFTRALYSTYLSYLPLNKFSYPIEAHGDERGVFIEMLKTLDSGQFSFFTAHPGITRGGHYHHTKTEKFLVIKGLARFGFRSILTNEKHSIEVSGQTPEVVETIPGWSHDICNVGNEELIVMLWANEIFDRDRPDTITSEV